MTSNTNFHPAIREWFETRFEAPTAAQAAAWPEIQAGRDTLLSAPTGSGKTLAAFLVCLDGLMRRADVGELRDEIDTLYVSPLKALSSDIRRNLVEPIEGITLAARRLGLPDPAIRTALRTGDTTAKERAAVVARPPHILITTPESLYLLLTAERSRERLRSVRTVIVDEIHALLRDKRGSHLSLSLARLDHVAAQRPMRIGLSATVHPIDVAARFLVGAHAPDPAVLQLDARRDLDLAIEVPPIDLEGVCSHQQWADIYDRLAELARGHRTTLIFVNTRARSERIAHHLAERLGETNVASHHGSLSKERRFALEERLKSGTLSALVATASLELGIDIGSVDLVCQIESPRSIATFLQRIGRSGHALGKTPKGRLFPTTRDELVECVALIRAVRSGRLDRVNCPNAPLDILAQQLVAECASEPWREDDLFNLARSAAPYAALERRDFDEVIELLSDGIPTGVGRVAEWLHRDRVNGVLHGRRTARRTAIECGGAIPDAADYRVLAEPDALYVGTLNEDFAIESQAGDVFLLGSTSWQIRKIEPGIVRVADAKGAPPTIPFWLGEAPARTAELSSEVSRLRAEWLAGKRSETTRGREDASLVSLFSKDPAIPDSAAEQLDRYLAAEETALGTLPTQEEVVFERFFDESGGMQLVVHAPFGGRINRAFGLSLRKRFCRTFDFELQAAANDDAIVLSLGSHQSFPLESIFALVRSEALEHVLSQAVLATPMFGVRWRWNASRALALLRQKHGKRVPPPIQRMRAEDLMAAVFPQQVACQENVSGPIELPDHVLVRQTMHDCLREAMDLDGLRDVLIRMESGAIRMVGRDTTEPSPFAHEIVSAKPWAYLDDAPIEERRTQAVQLRRGLPEKARDLGALDLRAIDLVLEEARPEPRNPEELHELLHALVVLDPERVPFEFVAEAWGEWFDALIAAGRATVWMTPSGTRFWVVAERLRAAEALLGGAPEPRLELTDPVLGPEMQEDIVATLVVRGWMELLGPVTIEGVERTSGLASARGGNGIDGGANDRAARGRVEAALAQLELEGVVLRGSFRPGAVVEEFCDRRLLARIHRYTLDRLRREIEPVSAQDALRFLLRWQHLAPLSHANGKRGLLEVVQQLQGFEAPVRAWERHLFANRVEHYDPARLDELCLTGQVVWARLSLPRVLSEDRPASAPASPSTPITLVRRADLPWLLHAVRGDAIPDAPTVGIASEIFDLIHRRGALFLDEIAATMRRLRVEVERGLWELVGRGLVTADGFQALRQVATSSREFESKSRAGRRRRGIGERGPAASGRWSLLVPPHVDAYGDDARGIGAGAADARGNDATHLDPEALAEAWAGQLLRRYGVVFRDVASREEFAVPWRDLFRALRRFEARGQIRGGRFVQGFRGEQFALPEAIALLRDTRRRDRTNEEVLVNATDPLNLAGFLTPGPRIPAVTRRTVLFVDGLPEEGATSARSSSGSTQTPRR